MKHMTIWQRLTTALAVLVVLLIVGCGLALWIEKASTTAELRSLELADRYSRISLDLALLGETVRGRLLEPTSEAEKKRSTEIDSTSKDLMANLEGITNTFPGRTELLQTNQNLR